MLVPVMAMASAIALVICTILSRQIAKPLLLLGRTAAEVVETDNYSIRADKLGEDEVGQVVAVQATLHADVGAGQEGLAGGFACIGRDAVGEPAVEPLLANVRGLRWRFLLNNNRIDAWPPGNNAVVLPDAIILELDLPDVGTLTRMISLR